MRERDHFQNLVIEERIILKIHLQEVVLGLRREIDRSASGQGEMASCGECDNKPLVSKKFRGPVNFSSRTLLLGVN
jgi:hypothetical protein